ncbi:MAG: peroxidase family protein [Hyphomicrobiaceae bacterium]
MSSSFTVNLADLTKILDQIKVAERHAAGENLVDIIGPDASLLPVGLRTVNGEYNHLLPGDETAGAADQPFPRLLTPEVRTGSGGTIDFDGAGGPGPALNIDGIYNATGSVIDTQPRTISNLIVDQTINNPAAVEAWFNNPLSADLFAEAHPGKNPVRPGEAVGPNDLEVSNADLSQIGNQSPDIGLSPQFNGFMTFFGQFFDHGLDLVPKGGNGSVYIPLQPDDPLYVEGSLTNFMVISRIQPNAINITTPFIDQNQTYTSHASHQVFLREYMMDGGEPIATGRLLSGSNHGLPTWADVKAHAAEMLGIQLLDKDIHSVPLLATDEYGRFERGPNGFAQFVTASGLVEANPDDNGGLGTLVPADAVPAGTAFLDDIAHNAAPGTFDPDGPFGPTPAVEKVADDDDTISQFSQDPLAPQQPAGTYDDELLDQHFITGDGRGNENIGLTAVHTVFHNEHDRVVEVNKITILASNNLAIINEWLAPNHQITELPANQGEIDALIWNGERLFQAGRFTTEMQYQHLVFEEFARKVQPLVDPFVFTNSADLDPAIIAEFAHTVYRFGHSMLNDTVDRLDNDLTVIDGTTEQIGLIEAFLNPVAFSNNSNGSVNGEMTAAEVFDAGVDAATVGGAIFRGITRQAGNEIDEFVVEALRNNLVGLPLDLAAINIARGRDAAIPSLNHAREELYSMTGDAQLKPYTSWLDFAQNIKNPESIINFIAAYGDHPLIAGEATLAGKRAAAMAIVFGEDQIVPENLDFDPAVNQHTIFAPTDQEAMDFLMATGAYDPVTGSHGDGLGGLNNVDLWIGGLAEEKMEFGGMLGSTFSAVFEYQMEHLQNGDRFYYLSRTQGMNLLNQLEPTTFADLLMRNTDLGDVNSTHIAALAFDTPDLILELDPNVAQTDYNSSSSSEDPVWDSSFQQRIDPKVVKIVAGDNVATAAIELVDVNKDGVINSNDNMLKFSGGEHVVLGGTEFNDRLLGDKGIDTLWGDGGNDYINAGTESDQVFGGEGDDIIEDPFGDNFLRGNQGNDVISTGHGLSIVFGDTGKDFLMASTDTTEFFAGEGNDFVLGGTSNDVLLGNEGDDWLEGGEGFDGLSGENSELFFNSTIIGHDVMNGQGNDTDYDAENGDDIMFQSAGIQRSNGMDGFDWAIHKGDKIAADSDLGIRIFDNRQELILRDRFDSVEGASGWKFDDTLTGAARLLAGEGFDKTLNQAGVDRIAGLDDVIGAVGTFTPGNPDGIVLDQARGDAGGEILLGGDGSDTIRGNLGDDIIDGDAWLNVRIAVYSNRDRDTIGDHVVTSVDTLTSKIAAGAGVPAAWVGKSLSELMLSGKINPGQLEIVREILYDNATDGSNPNFDTNIDVAVFADDRANYQITRNDDGTVTVEHTGFVQGNPLVLDSDGIDTLRNIEVARFADEDVFVGNVHATGVPTITGTENVLTADVSGIVDVNGVPSESNFSYQWQSSANGLGPWSDVATATSQSFTVPTGSTAFYRVAVSFFDDGGYSEGPITSIMTAKVGSNTNGASIETVNGTNDPNLLNGRAGSDVLHGFLGADVLNGGAGSDTLLGEDGSDILNGGDGADTLDGGLGADTMTGGDGNDIFKVDNVNDVVIEAGGGGSDTVRSTLSYTLSANVESLVLLGAATVGTGNAGNNTLNGASSNQVLTLNGGDGSDTLMGSTANGNILNGGDGADTLITIGGGNTLTGGDGNDQYTSVSASDTIIETNANQGTGGFDTLRANYNVTALAANVESLVLLGAATTGTGNAGNNTMNGTQSNQVLTLNGGDGSDVMMGSNANGNALNGGDGADTFITRSGGNILTGGNGNDSYRTISATDIIVEEGTAGSGFDTQYASYDNAIMAANVENMVLELNALTATGNNLGNTISANPLLHSAIIDGAGGNDNLTGSAFDDILTGGDGNDTIAGGGGDDTINFFASTTGRDFINGGVNGPNGDTFILNGTGDAETFRIYTRAAYLALGGGNGGLNGNTEIVITKNGTNNASIVAELDNIEEIKINTLDVTSNDPVPNGVLEQGPNSGDDIFVIGNFNAPFTSLNFNTITVNGGGSADTVDITGLTSDHRIVLNSNGGGDTIIGEHRAQDLIDSVSNVARASVVSAVASATAADPEAGTVGAVSQVGLPVSDSDDTFVFRASFGPTAGNFEAGDVIDLRPLFAALQLGDQGGVFQAAQAVFNAAGHSRAESAGQDADSVATISREHANDDDHHPALIVHIKAHLGGDWC